MHPCFKLPELVAPAEGMLKWVKIQNKKDYDHVIPKLEDAITRINQIMSTTHKKLGTTYKS